MSSFLGKLYFKLPTSQRLERIWKVAHIDFKKRYYDSAFGLVWALLHPLFRIGIYYFVFTVFIDHRMENFALYLFSGLLSWMYFVECSMRSMHTLTRKRYLIDSIQVNKVDLFYSSSISSTIGFVFNICAYIIIAYLAGIRFDWTILYVFPLIINLFLLSMAVGMVLSVIKIYFKDISYFWELATLLGFWTCPIFFRGELIIEKAPFIMYINPMSGLIMNSRAFLLGNVEIEWFWAIYGIVYTIILFIIAIMLIKKCSHRALEYM